MGVGLRLPDIRRREAVGINPYEVFGALAAFAFLAIGIALFTDLGRAG